MTVAPVINDPTRSKYAWIQRGDINAFSGLMLDNIGVMILMASLLVHTFGLPRQFVLTRMIPGTAVGVLIGDLIYTAMAFRLARRTGRSDITAMPLGLDTPSTFGAVLFIIGPAYLTALKRGLLPEDAAKHAWFIGIAMLVASGIFKIACAPMSAWIRRIVPRAGLLGSLAAIALVLISFLPLLDIAEQPIAGMVALILMLATLTARWEFPRQFPGALGAVVVGCLFFYAMQWLGLGEAAAAEGDRPSWALRAVLPMPVESWWNWFQDTWREALRYLPIAIPMALATVVGGIDCTESAAAAGDDYPTGQIIAVEGFATIFGALFGGVIQSTPYIGHPAYKAMGARAAYTLATALFVGAAGIFGFFDWIFFIIPKPVIFPILVFVGLEITSQSFHATPVRHYPAVAMACVPALAYLASLALAQILPVMGKPFAELPPPTQHWIQTVMVLAGGGTFIVTSVLWATALAHVIDGRVSATVGTLLLCAVFSWFGIIHSPLATAPIAMPGEVIAQLQKDGRYESFTPRLIARVNDVGDIPAAGKNVVIVAAAGDVLHFRVIDGDGEVVVDTDEKKLAGKAPAIEDLRKQLEGFWPPHELTGSEKARVLEAVSSILHGRYEATALQTPYYWSAAYLFSAVSLLALGRFGKTPNRSVGDSPMPV
jgi:adenine/guanine/hypoxanthine permease